MVSDINRDIKKSRNNTMIFKTLKSIKSQKKSDADEDNIFPDSLFLSCDISFNTSYRNFSHDMLASNHLNM